MNDDKFLAIIFWFGGITIWFVFIMSVFFDGQYLKAFEDTNEKWGVPGWVTLLVGVISCFIGSLCWNAGGKSE